MKTIFKTAIFALALAVTVSASAEGYNFNKNLTVGSKGADVTALQNRLAADGYFTGTATGYFGNVTKTAVKAFQTANNISPVSGYVGSITRGVLNSATPAGNNGNGVINQPVVLNGQEGFAEYRLSPTPVNNTNIQTNSDVPVYGIEFKAKNADISAERLTLDVSVLNGSSYENPATLINKITVKDGSIVLASLPVNTTTFSKYTGTTNYYVQISGISTKVAKDTIKTLTVTFDTNSIDTQRTVTVNVTSNGARVVDGRGISTYNNADVGVRTHVFKKPGASTLTVKSDAVTLYASNYRVNTTSNGTEKALTSTFAVKSESGPSKLTTVTVTAATSTGGTMPTNMYLYQGSTLLDSRTVPASGTVVFDIENSNVTVAQDTTTAFSVKVDMPATTVNGSTVTTTVTSVAYDKADGSSATVAGPVAGPYNFFASIVPVFAKTSSTVSVSNDQSSKGVSATADIRLNLTAMGGDIKVSSTTAVVGLKDASTGATVATSSVAATPAETGLSYFSDGATKAVTMSNVFASSSVSTTKNLKAFLQSVTYYIGNTAYVLSAGFEPFDSDNSATFNK